VLFGRWLQFNLRCQLHIGNFIIRGAKRKRGALPPTA
jgi:hypothetical protein